MNNNWINLPENTENIHSIIYLIRNNTPEVIEYNKNNIDKKKQFYIGTKQLLKRVKRKPLKGKTRNRIRYTDNGVEKYWGSSKELLQDIQKYGIENFTREVIEVCHSKFHAKFAEMMWQINCKVLFDDRYYNGIINIRLGKVPKDYIDIERNPDTLGL